MATALADTATVIAQAQFVLGLGWRDLAAIFQVSTQTLKDHQQAPLSLECPELGRYRTIADVLPLLELSLEVVPGVSSKTLTVHGSTLFAELCREPIDVQKTQYIAEVITRALQQRSAELGTSPAAEAERRNNMIILSRHA